MAGGCGAAPGRFQLPVVAVCGRRNGGRPASDRNPPARIKRSRSAGCRHPRGGLRFRRAVRARLGVPGQMRAENGALSGRALNFDETAGLPDDPAGRGEAEARVLVETLGRAERLENLAEGFRVQAWPLSRTASTADEPGRRSGRLEATTSPTVASSVSMAIVPPSACFGKSPDWPRAAVRRRERQPQAPSTARILAASSSRVKGLRTKGNCASRMPLRAVTSAG